METKFNKVTPEIVELIRNSVKGKVSVGPDVNPDYTHDEMPIYGSGSPDVLVEAKSTEEVAAIMKICYDNNINVIARGAGTGLVGASVAINGGVMIDMQSFNRILDYD